MSAIREYYACAAEVDPITGSANTPTGKIECVAIKEGECFFADTNHSLCKYIPGEALKKVVFERKYPGYTIHSSNGGNGGGATNATIANPNHTMPKGVVTAVNGMK